MIPIRTRSALMIAAAALFLATVTGSATVQPRFVISGRIEDPHHLRPANMLLMVGYERDGGGVAYPVTVATNGTYATNTLIPAKYVLTLFRDPHSPDRPSTPIGLSIAEVVDRDVTGVNVLIRRDVAIEGRFRMERGTPWPSSIHVNSCLAQEGLRLVGCQMADAAPDGKFILRNAFGERLLRVSAAIEGPGSQRYNEPRVLLDGKDVTYIPTDFSAKPSADLQVVFSRARTP
jgi:hypothetical protein